MPMNLDMVMDVSRIALTWRFIASDVMKEFVIQLSIRSKQIIKSERKVGNVKGRRDGKSCELRIQRLMSRFMLLPSCRIIYTPVYPGGKVVSINRKGRSLGNTHYNILGIRL